MTVKKLLSFALLLLTFNGFAQNITKIEAQDGIHYLTTIINYPVTGTYYFQGAEPIVELQAGGSGFYQLHEQVKRPVIWGMECDESGAPKFKKGFDNAAYTLWYQYTDRTDTDRDEDMLWKPVGFTVHFNSNKMFIQGERSKTFSGKTAR